MSDSGKLYMKELYNRDDELHNRYHIGIDTFHFDGNIVIMHLQ
jgi:hypothetical protein